MSAPGARRTRQITPTSPSPSPEPQAPTNGSTTSTAPRPDSSSIPASAVPPPSTLPSEPADPTEAVRATLEARTRAVVDLLYQLAVCSADVQEGSQHLVGAKVNECIKALAALDATKDEVHKAHLMVPQDVLEMLDAGKNPDIHTRNFINRLASENQYSYGQHGAVEKYNGELDQALEAAFPELSQAANTGSRAET